MSSHGLKGLMSSLFIHIPVVCPLLPSAFGSAVVLLLLTITKSTYDKKLNGAKVLLVFLIGKQR